MRLAQQILYPDTYVCQCADKYIACMLGPFIAYSMYKIGKKPDIDQVFEVERLRRLVCDNPCGMCEGDLNTIKEQLIEITGSKIGNASRFPYIGPS